MANQNTFKDSTAQGKAEQTKDVKHDASTTGKPTPEPDASTSGKTKPEKSKTMDAHPLETIQKGVDEGRYTHEQLTALRTDPQYTANVINEGSENTSTPLVSVSECDLEKAGTFKGQKTPPSKGLQEG